MFRALTLLAAASCLASPVFADRDASRDSEPSTRVLMAQEGGGAQGGGGAGSQGGGGMNRGGSRRDRMRREPMRRDGMRRDGMRGGGMGRDGMGRDGMMSGDMMMHSYPAYERRLPASFYRQGYRLTPREYYRLRASGFTPDEVYLIANASRATAMDPSHFSNAIYRGMYAREISLEWGIHPSRLTRVLPEWRSREWAEATGDPVFTRNRLRVYP